MMCNRHCSSLISCFLPWALCVTAQLTFLPGFLFNRLTPRWFHCHYSAPSSLVNAVVCGYAPISFGEFHWVISCLGGAILKSLFCVWSAASLFVVSGFNLRKPLRVKPVTRWDRKQCRPPKKGKTGVWFRGRRILFQSLQTGRCARQDGVFPEIRTCPHEISCWLNHRKTSIVLS